MSVERRAAEALKNYLCISAAFIIFATLVLISKAAIGGEVAPYLIAVGLLGLACVAMSAAKMNILRGFLPYCFVFLLFTAVFPASDSLGSSFPDVLLYGGFFGMIMMLLVLLWRAASYKDITE